MDAGTIYRRLPGLTEGEAVALALAYRLGEAWTASHDTQYRIYRRHLR